MIATSGKHLPPVGHGGTGAAAVGAGREYHQQALQIYIEYEDRYAQAAPIISWVWWPRSSGSGRRPKQHYQQALQISIEFHDRYYQAVPIISWA